MRTKLKGNTLSFGYCECCNNFAILRRVQVVKRNMKFEVPYQFADYFTDDRNFVQVCTRCEIGVKSFLKGFIKKLAKNRESKYPDWLTFLEMLAVFMRVQKQRFIITIIRSENENK